FVIIIFVENVHIVFIFFFFQAEDGILDFHVTGVQTCALPIWELGDVIDTDPDERMKVYEAAGYDKSGNSYVASAYFFAGVFEQRSEERRVGKECRCRGWAEYYR